MTEQNEIICRNCRHFDSLNADREPFGTKILDSGLQVELGVCRDPNGYGLVRIGIIPASSVCRQRPQEDHFQSIKQPKLEKITVKRQDLE